MMILHEDLWYFTESAEGEKRAVHVIPRLNVRDKGFYREVVSMGAFDERNVERIYNKKKKKTEHLGGIRFHRASLIDFEMHLRFEDRAYALTTEISPLHTIPWYAHPNLWAFYTAIGYDYKRGRLKSWSPH